MLPHRRPAIGSIEQLDAATLDDARAFHEAYYGPDTATLIVSGNFDQAQLDAGSTNISRAIPRARPAAVRSQISRARDARAPRRAASPPTGAQRAAARGRRRSGRCPGSAIPTWPRSTVLDAILSPGRQQPLAQGAGPHRARRSRLAELVDSTQEGGYHAPSTRIVTGGRPGREVAALIAAEIERVRSRAGQRRRAAPRPRTSCSPTRSPARDRLAAAPSSSARRWSAPAMPSAADQRLPAIARVTAADVQRVARDWLAPRTARSTFTYHDESRRRRRRAWTNPAPMPTFASVPPAIGEPANALADEAQRQAPPRARRRARGDSRRRSPRAGSPTASTVVTAQTGSVPLATMTVVVQGGTATDPHGKAGLAELAADLADKGTADPLGRADRRELESLGAT